VAEFNDANQRGPHWADPLKAWGDLLAKQGRTKEAPAKYDEALKYAPNWKHSTKRASRLRGKRADLTSANRTVVDGSWGSKD
jgi:predicted RNA polymerase sigma factor